MIYLSPSMQTANRYAFGDTNEEAVCNKIADALEEELQARGIPYLRAGRTTSLTERCRQSNRARCKIHLSIHTNAAGSTMNGTAEGCEVLYHPSAVGISKKLCQPVYCELVGLGLRPRGLKPVNPFWVEPKATTAATIYLEIDFHDNPARAKWLIEHTSQIAAAIARGLS